MESSIIQAIVRGDASGLASLLSTSIDLESSDEALWNELVPPSGQCGTVQREQVRAIGRIHSEAYRNGNANWDADYRRTAQWMANTLLGDEALFSEARRALEHDLRQVSRKMGADIGPDSAYEHVFRAVVAFCARHRDLIPRERDSSIRR